MDPVPQTYSCNLGFLMIFEKRQFVKSRCVIYVGIRLSQFTKTYLIKQKLFSNVAHHYGIKDQGYKIRKIFEQKSTYPKEIIEFWELD